MSDAMKYVVQVQGREEITELTNEIKKQEKAILDLNAQLKAGTINQTQFATAAQVHGEKIAVATTQMHELERAGISAGRGAGQGLLQLGYAIDDLQYGFTAIVNNIPQIVYMLGGGAGLAGVVGIAAVAINQLVNHWSELATLAQGVWLGQSADQLANLAARATDAAEAFNKLSQKASSALEAQAKGVTEKIVEASVGDVLKGVFESVQHDPTLAAKVVVPRGEILGFNATHPENPLQRSDADDARDQEKIQNMSTAKRIMTEAGLAGDKGKQARDTLTQLLKNQPGAFPEGFTAQDIENLSPEGQKRVAQGQLERQGETRGRKLEDELKEALNAPGGQGKIAQGQLERQGETRGRKLEDELKEALNKALTLQGKENEQEGNKRARLEHKKDVQGAQDEAAIVEKSTHELQRQFEKRKEQLGDKTQILSGGKSVVDYYQKSVGDQPLVALAKEQKEIMIQQREKLEKIREKIQNLNRMELQH